MSKCPNGHDSKDPEWCDTCGAPLQGGIGAASVAATVAPYATSAAGAGTGSGTGAAASGAVTMCPACGDANPESNLFCESCGLDFVTGQLPPPVVTPDPALAAPVDPTGPLVPATPVDLGVDLGWSATLTIDKDWFAAKGEGIGTPPDRAPRSVDLRHGTVLSDVLDHRALTPASLSTTITAFRANMRNSPTTPQPTRGALPTWVRRMARSSLQPDRH